jgi:branched-chain amino acid aminotransferase
MEKNVSYNGRLYPAGTPLIGAANRGLRYGDGVFETIKVKNGALLLGDLHFIRLWKGLDTLRFTLPLHFTPAFLEGEILELCRCNGHSGLARVRLTLFRGDGGVNDLLSHDPHYIIETWPLERIFTPADAGGLDIGIFPEGRKAIDAYSNLKTNNYLLYLMGALWAKEHHLGECLVLNSRDRVADASISNLFYVSKGMVFTPPLGEGGVDGVLRRYLLGELPGWGWEVSEKPVEPEALLRADELFVTNAITGIRWVKSFGRRSYDHPISAAISHILEDRFS